MMVKTRFLAVCCILTSLVPCSLCHQGSDMWHLWRRSYLPPECNLVFQITVGNEEFLPGCWCEELGILPTLLGSGIWSVQNTTTVPGSSAIAKGSVALSQSLSLKKAVVTCVNKLKSCLFMFSVSLKSVSTFVFCRAELLWCFT